MLRLLLAVLLAALPAVLAPSAHAQAPDALPELRGVWVHEVSLGNAQAVDQTIREIAEAGLNVAYVRTWFQGVTIYPSDVVEAAGGPRQHRTSVGRDPLREAIDAGRRYGVEIGAWMEYGLVAHTGYATGLECDSPGPILEANPSWSMVHRNGYTAEPPSQPNGLCFYWMDPANPEVIAFMADMASEIAARYPDLALYEADRFRYPSLDWSYAEATIARYVAETGLRDPRTVPAGDPERTRWRDWRRDQTTGLMREVYTAVKAANPSVVVSGAVVPPYMIDTSQDKLQHWPTWAAEGVIDIVEPMLYLPDTPDFQNQLGLALGRMPAPPPPGSRPRTLFAAGIEARDDPRYNVPFQIEEARRRGTDGVVLWCWDRCPLASWRPTLRQGVFAAPATLPFDDRIAGARYAFVDLGGWGSVSGGWDGSYYEVSGRPQADGGWFVHVYRAGHYDVYAHWPAGEGRAPDATYRIEAEGTEATFVADQGVGEGWRFLGQTYLGTPGRVIMRLEAGSEGTTVLDAVRLVRSQPFRATEALAVGERTVQVRFNYPPDPASVAPERFTLAGATVTSASSSPEDPFVVVLGVEGLSEGETYTLSVGALVDTQGRALADDAVAFTFDPARLARTVAPGDATFALNGTWGTVSEEAAPGGTLRTAPGGVATNRARWTATLPETGRYELSVWLPEGDAGRTPRAAYLVAYGGARFDTVYVDQRQGQGGWHALGVYPYDGGGLGLVQLLGALSEGGEMVASAARWRRTLQTVEAEGGALPAALALGAPYPNPTRGGVLLPVEASAPGTLRLQVFDLLGRRVAEAEATFGAGHEAVPLDLSHLPAGTYIIRPSATPGEGGTPQPLPPHRVVLVR